MDQTRSLGPEDPVHIGGFRLVAAISVSADAANDLYLGWNDELGVSGVAKVLRRDLCGPDTVGRECARRFANEIAFHRRFHSQTHKLGVVPEMLEASDEQESPPWHVTEVIQGLNLHRLVQRIRCGLPPRLVLSIAADLAEMLDRLHQFLAAHRDLKPGNVIITLDGPKIVDFGLSRTAGDTPVTGVGRIAMTPQYAAPERFEGGVVDETRSDVFELGGTVLYALTGTAPYPDGIVEAAAAASRWTVDRDDLAARIAAVPVDRSYADAVLIEGLLDVLATCLERDPDRRATAAEVAARCRDLDPDRPPFSTMLPPEARDAIAEIVASSRTRRVTVGRTRPVPTVVTAPAPPAPTLTADPAVTAVPRPRASSGWVPRWRRRLASPAVALHLTGPGRDVVAVGRDGQLVCFAGDDGDVRRGEHLGEESAPAAVTAGKTTFVGTRTGHVVGLVPTRQGPSLRRQWVGGRVLAMAASSDRVVALSSSGVVVAFAVRSFDILWETPVPVLAGPSSILAPEHGAVVVVGRGGTITALDPQTGSRRGDDRLGVSVDAAVWAGDGAVVVATPVPGEIRRVAPGRGDEWVHRTGEPCGALAADHGLVAAVSITGLLTVLDPAGGGILRTVDLQAPVNRSVAVLDHGTVLVGGLDGVLATVDVATGAVRRTNMGAAALDLPVAADGDRVAVASADGGVALLERSPAGEER